jgi:transglutaminase-like putative cysteine protease
MNLSNSSRFVDTSPPVRELAPAARADALRLRATLVALTLLGVLALVRSDLLGAPLGVLAALIAVGSACVAVMTSTPRAATARRATAGTLLGLLVFAAAASSVVSGEYRDAAVLAGCAVASLHPALQDRLRELGVGLLVAVLPLALACALEIDTSHAGAVLLAAVPFVYALVLLSSLRRRAGVPTTAPTSGGLWSSRAAAVACGVLVLALAAGGAAAALDAPDQPDAFRGFGDGGDRSRGNGDLNGFGGNGDGAIDLNARGELPDIPVWHVDATSPGLWRDSDARVYTGQGWEDDRLPARVLAGDARIPDNRSFAGDTVGASGVSLAAPARWSNGSGTGIAPGRPEAVSIRPVDDLLVRDSGEFEVAIGEGAAPGSGLTPGMYEVAYTRLPTVDEALTLDPVDPATRPALDDPALLELPGTVPDRVRDLAVQLTDDAPSPAAAMRAVSRHVTTNATYSLNSPVPSAEQDAVDHFLFESRSGACGQFATATVVLLRAAGIPARLATGYSGGVDVGNGWRELRVSDAHAWVEAWLPGIGWVSADPTAGSARTAESDVLGDVRESVVGFLKEHGAALVVVLLVVLLVVGAAVVAVRATRWRRAGIVTQGSTSAAVLAFARLEQRLRRTRAPRAAAETVDEVRARFGRDPELVAAFDVVQRDLYAAEPAAATSDRTEAAAAVIDGLVPDPR